MSKKPIYELPRLEYTYDALEPYISREQLELHHQKHHQGYVNSANALFEKLSSARRGNKDLDMKSMLKDLSFQVGGHLLHSLFWKNLAPADQDNNKPCGVFADAIKKEFGSFEKFKKEFSQTATSVEGSGWAALAYCQEAKKPLIMQIEKHNVNVYPMLRILLVLDVWEHAYYLDYKNARAKFVEAFWNIVDWKTVASRITK